MDTDQETVDRLFQNFVESLLGFDELVECGQKWLLEDMKKYESYVPERSRYHEKNKYMYRANTIGLNLLISARTPQAHYFAEQYYQHLLAVILEGEPRLGKHFNKGIVYANLGIAQIRQQKFDAGIAHLLTAEWEDREVVDRPDFILDTSLWEQFEQSVFGFLFDIAQKLRLTFTIDQAFLKALFSEMDREDRIFLQGNILALEQNLEQLKVCSNSYTWGRLYAFLQDMCLLIESMLRKKRPKRTDNQVFTLGHLLGEVCKEHQINLTSQRSTSSGLEEFVEHLDLHLQNNSTEPNQLLHCLLLVRNFTGHHFRLDEDVRSNGGLSLQDMYSQALYQVLGALLYLREIRAL